MHYFYRAVFAILVIAAPESLPSATYTGSQAASNGDTGLTAAYSITTNDKMGLLDKTDITSYSVEISMNGLSAFIFTDTSLGAQLNFGANAPLFATSTNLSFDFSALALDSDAAFNATNPSGFVGSLAFGPGIVAIATGDGYSANNLLVSGVQTIGQVANVPEPATWMMMIAGLGLICAQLRRRKPLVSFA